MKLLKKLSRPFIILMVSLGFLMGCSLPLPPKTSGGTSSGNSQSPSNTSGHASVPATPGPERTTPFKTSDPVETKPSASNTSQPVTVPVEEKFNENFPEGAVVARRLLGSVYTLNPQKIQLSFEAELSQYLFGSLFHLAGNSATDQAALIPFHAKDLPQTSDLLHYTISLKPGLTWSDGSPLTAFDYVWSMEQLLDPDNKNPLSVQFTEYLPLVNGLAYHLGELNGFPSVGFKALDAQTLQLNLTSPRSPKEVARSLTLPLLIAQKVYEKTKLKGESAYGEDWNALIYSGAYVLQDFHPGQQIVLKRRKDSALDEFFNTNYTSDYITLRHYDSNLSALNAFYQGELDLVPVAGTAYKKLKDDSRIHLAESNTVWGIYLNLNDPIVSDLNFRRALYWGTDRSAIALGLFGSYKSYSGFVGPESLVPKHGGMVSYRKTKESRANANKANVYDLKKANTYVGAMRERMGEVHVLELIIPADNPQMLAMGELLKSTWERLFAKTLEIKLTPLSLSEAYGRYRAGNYQLGFGAMGQDVFDPWHSMMAFRSDFPGKLDQMRNTSFDELCDEANLAEIRLDPQRRLDLLQQMESLLLEELPQIPLFINTDAYLISEQLILPFKKFIPGVGFGLDQAGKK